MQISPTDRSAAVSAYAGHVQPGIRPRERLCKRRSTQLTRDTTKNTLQGTHREQRWVSCMRRSGDGSRYIHARGNRHHQGCEHDPKCLLFRWEGSGRRQSRRRRGALRWPRAERVSCTLMRFHTRDSVGGSGMAINVVKVLCGPQC